jgi:N utilization substance protein A
VPDYQLSLAIGKEGQNARLAARLTGWRIDIKSETQIAEEGRAPAAPVAAPLTPPMTAPTAEPVVPEDPAMEPATVDEVTVDVESASAAGVAAAGEESSSEG